MSDATIRGRSQVTIVGPNRDELARLAREGLSVAGLVRYSTPERGGPRVREEVYGTVELPGGASTTLCQANWPAPPGYKEEIDHAPKSAAGADALVLIQARHVLDVAGHPSARTLGITLVEDFRPQGSASG